MKRTLTAVASVLSLLLSLGIGYFFVVGLPVVKAQIDSQSDMAQLKLVAKTLAQIEEKSFKKCTAKDLIYSGIRGMMRTLDPYSQFLDEEAFKYFYAQQSGSFFGIGISFDLRDGKLLVIAPIEGTPAWKLGLKPGDVIVEIEGKSTTGITTAEVVKKLRGKKGTKVAITVKRPGTAEPLHFEIVRDKIALNSLKDSFMLNDDTGYVRITEFSSTTGNELKSALKTLSKQGMKQLIIDIRSNGGGLLSAADAVSSMFLHKGDLIVSTRGRRKESDMELRVKKEGPYVNLPLIILVNDGSASASEILAGSMQDYDRGLILGIPTHGKGLVGSQFPTKFGTAAQVTTGQYFTNSGRFIQRPYDIPHRKRFRTETSDTNTKPKEYHTKNGRKVYSKGGITPDVIFETPEMSSNIFRLEMKGVFFDFAVKNPGKWVVTPGKFRITDEIYNAFRAYLEKIDFELPDELNASDNQAIKDALLREFYAVQINPEAGDKIRILNQQIVKKAISLFPDLPTILSGTQAEKTAQQKAS